MVQKMSRPETAGPESMGPRRSCCRWLALRRTFRCGSRHPLGHHAVGLLPAGHFFDVIPIIGQIPKPAPRGDPGPAAHCQPNWVDTGPTISSIFAPSRATLNSGNISATGYHPSSPQFFCDSSPENRSAPGGNNRRLRASPVATESARARTKAESALVGLSARGRWRA